MKTALDDLADLGQSPWLDGIGRGALMSGGLVDLVARGVRGLTTNSALVRGAITDGDHTDAQRQRLRDVVAGAKDSKQAYLDLAVADARQACAMLEGTVTGPGPRDAWVSLEVDPRFAHDVRSTVEEAYLLHRAVDHPRFLVKIPGTVQGLVAVEEATALGVRVDVSLLFSVFRHRQAAEAYVRGLRRLRDNGGNLRTMSSVASFSVSHVDAAGDEALRAVGGDPDLAGRLAVANAKIAYRTYKEVFSGMAWEELSRAGAQPQWPLWASTSTKDPTFSDVKYVESLIGPDTVITMSRSTIEAFLDHGRVGPTLEDGVEEAGAVLDGFRRAGVDYDTLTGHLEKAGIRDFNRSFTEMLKELAALGPGR
ncbi:transaldolase [Catenulispora subtropica]|uniref:Transaldolase n=1 Tax=Catenulispora subtropica TaxID=450798 RepID=A0ABP5EMS6_9ACTN